MGVPPMKKRERSRGNLGESGLNLPENGLCSFKQWLSAIVRAKLWTFRLVSRNGAGLSELPTWNSCAGVSMMPTEQHPGLDCFGPTMKRLVEKDCLTRMAMPSADAPRMADDDRKRRNEQGGPGTAVITKTKPQTKRPNMYRVLILNDDYTPMEFVVHVLERFFGKDHEAATRIMLHVHHHGIGECGVYTYEVAETKVTQVMDFARKHQHPLQCVMEKK